MAEVGAVILAAGESSRLGRPKQLVEFRGRTLLGQAIDAARSANCRPIVVVTGSDAVKIASAINAPDITITENPDWRRGLGTSIRRGMQHLIEIASETQAVVLLACDQPFVTPDVIARLITEWQATGRPIVASAYADTLGVPALFARSCFDELLQLPADKGAKPIIYRNRERVAQTSFPEGASDIDTSQDYERIRSAGSTDRKPNNPS